MKQDRLQGLRTLMKKNRIAAYLVPSTDPHQNEYLPAAWERRRWLSGFTGSAGDMAVTLKSAGLWTDSRYFLQAETQLKNSGIQLFKLGLPDTPLMSAWLIQQLKPGERAGIDPRVISYQDAQKLKTVLANGKIIFQPIEQNLVDKIWKDQPPLPQAPIIPHPLKFAGESVPDKLKRLRERMKQERVKTHIITNLDAIAWLFNIRGRDIDFNPLVISYAIITLKKAWLFTSRKKVDRALSRHLGRQVQILEYQDFPRALKKLAVSRDRIWVDPSLASWWVVDNLDKKCELFFKEAPITRFKALKNSTEISGLKAALVRDGVAMVKFLCWLEGALGREKITEISAAAKLEDLRSGQDLFQGLSFHTISAYREHGAIVHYSATEESDSQLRREGIYLIDSGAHYSDGTTDITRTLALGRPTEEQKDRFTRVLKGHIQLAMTRFPAGTAGNQLDTLARKPLWDVGLNYGHGTGHGIGSYLNVHEGPQAISYYRGLGVVLEPGMVISNEPGFYQTGEYGIRTENLILTDRMKQEPPTGIDFLAFQTVTLCPIDTRLIERSLLVEEEVTWLNDYHSRVRETLSQFLDPPEKDWLETATAPI